MSERTVNGVLVEDILHPVQDDPELVERIAERKVKRPELAIVEPDPRWPEHFETFKSRILTAFQKQDAVGQTHIEDGESTIRVDIVAVRHVGSTSVPGLPAKAVIDIDLVLSSNGLSSEPFYVPRLEAAGFQFLLREPAWHEHRFFYAWEPMPCNLHVWGPGSAEVERHRIFRDWLREHEDDRELYARTKRGCAALSKEKGEGMREYTVAKDAVVAEILMRAFTKLGYLEKSE